jgi:SAM-dependent methyltransferase
VLVTTSVTPWGPATRAVTAAARVTWAVDAWASTAVEDAWEKLRLNFIEAIKLGKHHGVTLKGIVAAGENLGVPENHYDIIYTANTVHHVTDKRQFFQQIRRALKPGGRFFTWDPLAYNPLIGVYRRMATKVRTEDEAPLTFEDVALAREFFSEVEHREFWICTLTLFLKYYLVDRIHPNDKRYWKLIYEESPSSLRWWSPLKTLDEFLTRLPLVRRLAWNMVMTGRKSS